MQLLIQGKPVIRAFPKMVKPPISGYIHQNAGKENSLNLKSWLLITLFTVLLSTVVLPVQAEGNKFLGEVNDTQQLVTDDQVYEIDDNEMGDRLVYDHIGERVEVSGTVQEIDDMKIITVKSFKIVSE